MKRSSISEIIFSLMLFLMFVIGGFLLISYSGNIYKGIISDGEKRQGIQIPLAYLSEKLYQAQSKDYVSIEKLDGVDVLIIENENYVTCIYCFDGYMKELNINDIDNFNVDDGTSIYALDDLKMNYVNNLYEFTVTNDGNSESVTLYLR